MSSNSQFVSGTPLNVEALAKAMEKLSNAKEPSNRTGLSRLKGRWQLDKQIKEVKVLVAGKGKTNIDETALLEKISQAVNDVNITSAHLDTITQGLEIWKERMITIQPTPLRRFLIFLLGVGANSQKNIETMNKTIQVVKSRSLTKKLENLNSQLTEKITLLETKNKFFQNSKNSQKPSEKDNIQAQYQQTRSELEGKFKKKLTKIVEQVEEETKEMQIAIVNSKTILKKHLGISIITTLSEEGIQKKMSVLEQKVRSSNEQSRQQAIDQFNKSVELNGDLKAKEKKLEDFNQNKETHIIELKAQAQNEYDNALAKSQSEEKQKLNQDEAFQQSQLQSLNKQEAEIAEIKNEIQDLSKHITTLQQELETLQAPEPVTPDANPVLDVQHRNERSEPSSVLALLGASSDPSNKRIEGIKENIRNALGYGEHGHASTTYLEYQQKMIFGFSFGQRKTVNELKGQDLNENDLQDMLEGGNEVTNMFHLALSLEEQIKYSQGKTPEYIAKLRSMLADLERSLPLALQGRALDHTTDTSKSKATRDAIAAKHHRTKKTPKNTLSDDVNQALLNMNPGKRLFLPIGTAGHAALLCLKKEQNGMITPIIYNTGEGVEAFESPVTQIKNQFRAQQKSPLKVTYPSFSIQSSFDLSTLLKNRQTDQNISTLYDEAKKLFGRHVTKSKPQETQVSGVCSFQVFTAAFHDILGEADHHQFQYDHFRQIQSEFKQISQTLTVENSPSPSLVSPSVHFLGAHDQQFNPQAIATGVHQALLDDLTKEIQVLDSKLAKQKK